MSDTELTSLALRAAIRQKFAWPGGYCLIFITDDGAALCADCCRKEYRQIARARRENLRDGWRVVAISNGSNCDGSEMCDHCSAELGAYAEEEPAEPCQCGADAAEQRPCICAQIRDGSLIGLTAPAHWASYLINGDATGFDTAEPFPDAGTAEQARADAWLDSLADSVEPGGPVDCRPFGFCHRPDAGGLACDAETYYFTAKRDAGHSTAEPAKTE